LAIVLLFHLREQLILKEQKGGKYETSKSRTRFAGNDVEVNLKTCTTWG